MTKLEQLKKVIQEANPEVTKKVCLCTHKETKHANNYGICQLCNCSVFGNSRGRSIRLADVIFVARERYETDSEAMISIFPLFDRTKNKIWNLTDDNLDHQSEETINWLWDSYANKRTY